ncbi:uncharacterized protein HD556DRAFT_789261 [Suillus plorans]|uniref:Hydrophobin n=1 Tax=Suillus plorans TaxID=116603 RepID=A0A9P7J499_9AGAM|nr:uncharacterized protein HD556DRAFT_789261 [Suillus plorans]KAG1802018.1 hypothetical protein HD556DRAFT_789261 [Suillus plorans]
MRFSFRVVLIVAAALTMSMAVSASELECQPPDNFCDSSANDCCPGYDCTMQLLSLDVSMSSFIQNLLTHQRGSRYNTYIYACEIG